MNKKLLIMVVCAALAVAGAAMSTVAFLTDRDTVSNIFTVGDVQITLDEAKVNREGVPVDENGNILPEGQPTVRVIANDYHLVPGLTYVKDPTLTVVKGNEECFVRLMVTVTKYQEVKDILAALSAETPVAIQDLVIDWDPAVWVYKAMTEDTENNTATYELRYFEKIAPQQADLKLPALFTAITVPGEVTGDQLATVSGLQVLVNGHAIQTASFADEDAAWAAFDAQETPAEANP